MKNFKKSIALLVAVSMIVGCVIGGTLAWLVDQTREVTNTFTVGDINIDLTETTSTYKMVPGNDIAKDPKVTVEANSEACWLFVQVKKSENYETFLENPVIANGWTPMTGSNNPLDSSTGVYYRTVDADTAKTGTEYYVLAGDATKAGYENGCVTVKTDVTKAQMNALTEITYPTLTFTAYAVQKDNVATVEDAWVKAQSSSGGTVVTEPTEPTE